jgi:hypothetical protein
VKSLIKSENLNKTLICNDELKVLYSVEELPKPEIEEIHHIRVTSDGTLYDLLVFELKGKFSDVHMGTTVNGLLVCANRASYMFRKGDYLSEDYLQEKLKIYSTTDARNFKRGLVELGLVK